MQLKIGENVRTFRKERGLTQEQLAEAVGVTVGAVSKWESGASNPDIALLPELAELFGISTDVLLGYRLEGVTAHRLAEEIKKLRLGKRYEEGKTVIEKALRKFPDSFEVVYCSAKFLHMKGVEEKDRVSLEKALSLCERACTLIGQNTDEEVSELSIEMEIGSIYVSLDRTDEAVDHLKKYNFCGINNGEIGFILSGQKRWQEARCFLSDSYLESLTTLIRTVVGFVNCYDGEGDSASALAMLEWLRGVLRPLNPPDRVSYLDKIEVMLLCACAQVTAVRHGHAEAKKYLCEARRTARQFDAAPDFGTSTIRFYAGQERSVFDDFGTTAMEGIRRSLSEDEKTAPLLTQIWEELEHEDQQ